MYDDVVKRGPKTSNPYTQPYPQLSVRKTEEPKNPQSLMSSFELSNIPFIPKERLFLAIEYVENEIAGKENTYVPDEDDLALIYALKACTQSQFDIENASASFEKSRALVMTKLDLIFTNIQLLACALFLGVFCVMTNDYDRAMFFLDNVKSFFERSTLINDPSIGLLRMIYDDVINMSMGDRDIERQLKRMIAQMNSVQMFRNRNDPQPYRDGDLSFDEIDKVETDLRCHTDLYALVPQRVNMISERLTRIMDQLTDKMPAHAIEIMKYSTLMYLQGAIAQRSFRFGEYKQATQAADVIAHATASPLFQKAFVSLAQVVSLAANVHLFIWCMSSDKQVKSNALNCLSLELDALVMIRSKNKIIGPSLEDVVQKVSYMLRTAQEQILVNQITNQVNSYQFEQTIEELILNVEEGKELAIESGSREATDVIDQFFLDFVNET
jgi:hypothetical protein